MEDIPQIKTENQENLEFAETPQLETEKALVREKGVFEKFKGKAKDVARVMMLVSVLSAGSGVVSEAYAQNNTGNQTRVEQAEKTKATKTFVLKQFKVGTRESVHEVTVEFMGTDVETALTEQNVHFDEAGPSFTLLNETGDKRVVGIVEINGIYTQKFEVSLEKVSVPLPGGKNSEREIIKLKSHNSDSSVETLTIEHGRITGYVVEK